MGAAEGVQTCVILRTFMFQFSAGSFICCYFRVSSGQGKVREIPDLAKVREKSGNFVEGQGKNEYWEKVREKSGNLHLVQSK